MGRKEATNVLEQRGGYAQMEYVNALRIAIGALRGEKAPEKMDRIRRKDCVKCRIMSCVTCENVATATECEPCRECVDFSRYKILKFCPFCGRPLTEEAWAELERRINSGTAN